ncbi:MAG: desulfoferrodoxin family protein [Candidatus Thiodiazotropha sp.]
MDRRTFLLSSSATTAIATLSSIAQATENSSLPPKNLIFTEKNGGKWRSKKGTHVPKFEINGRIVKVNTDHGQSEYHYIVRHTLLLEDGTMVGAKTFMFNDAPMSEYELPVGYKGRIIATSFCNKHDLWLAETYIG